MYNKHENVYKNIEDMRNELVSISLEIFNNPELGYKEYNSCKLLTEFLKKNGFEIDLGILNMDTSFIATYDSLKEGRAIGLIAEYDALPEIGHACGHNLFSVAACGAAVALKEEVDKSGGKVVVIGTPCEEVTNENAGGKVPMAREGVFDNLDIAMMCHGDNTTYVKRYLVASTNLKVKFYGTAIHAGGDVTNGKNALTAAILTINNINAIRQHFFTNAVVNPIITNGGVLPNTIPNLSELRFTIRATNKRELEELMSRVENCIKAASLTTGCEYEITRQKHTYYDTRPNDVLAKLFSNSLEELGVEYTYENTASFAWDVGNVSYRVPTLCPYIKIGPDGILCHSDEFLEASHSEAGFNGLMIGAKAMASTAVDYLESKEIQEKVNEEFKKLVK
ncbi:M20 family metallopeptidase [Neofamilia massiliensis]|uniref:M20 family metallopeptidase n=1 Tax=Neofamilia massiliensis TaxID=1673724 RepID=UPI0006BB5F7C|nr:M20 family metallopeptidase [Neofamilia massiliensis]